MIFLETPITSVLIAANILISVMAFQNEAFLKQNLFVVGPILRRGEYYRLISSGFLHLNLMHLFVNMFVLFQVGPTLETWLGPPKFALLYSASLLGGSLWSLMENKKNLLYSALGASGATSGLLMAFCLASPTALFIFPPAPAWLAAIGYFAITAILARLPNQRIGHDAHMGGMLFGGFTAIMLAPYIWPRFIDAIEKATGLA